MNRDLSEYYPFKDHSLQNEWQIESGKRQSPIHILSQKLQAYPDGKAIDIDYFPFAESIEDTGYSIQVNHKGEAKINGRLFQLVQYHFHTESEHVLNHQRFPLEAHFVHQAANGTLAVIGIFFKEGAASIPFQKVLDRAKKQQMVAGPFESEWLQFFPKNRNYVHYLGSLTTPPLTENVEWYIMEEPMSVSRDQIEAFRYFYQQNNRKLQDIGDRCLLHHKH